MKKRIYVDNRNWKEYQKNFLKNRLPYPEGWSLIGDFSNSEIFWMLGNNRILRDAVFNVPYIMKS